jgi:hypothetical protein
MRQGQDQIWGALQLAVSTKQLESLIKRLNSLLKEIQEDHGNLQAD